MFQHLKKSEKCVIAGVLSAIFYFLFSLIFGIGQLLATPTLGTMLKILPSFWPLKLLISGGFSYLIVYTGRNLDDIEAKTAGQGQHGSARWATEKEKPGIYSFLPEGGEQEPGFVIGRERHRWITDISDCNLLLLAPPGGGKTKRVMIPTVYYNAMVNRNTKGKGASLLFTDCKGELKQSCGEVLKRSGYRCLYLDFRNPLMSYQFNLMKTPPDTFSQASLSAFS